MFLHRPPGIAESITSVRVRVLSKMPGKMRMHGVSTMTIVQQANRGIGNG